MAHSLLSRAKRGRKTLPREAEQSAPVDGTPCISPAPAHVELAAKISSHREAVSREMSMLAKKGLIEKRGNRLLLRNAPMLELLVASDD